MTNKWEYKHIFLDIYERGCITDPSDPETSAVKENPYGEAVHCPWWQKALEEILNEYGSAGWEVTAISDKLLGGEDTVGFVLLKRRSSQN